MNDRALSDYTPGFLLRHALQNTGDVRDKQLCALFVSIADRVGIVATVALAASSA